MATDTQHMAKALALAERGRGRTSPNPMVGAVIVNDEGVVVGHGASSEDDIAACIRLAVESREP